MMLLAHLRAIQWFYWTAHWSVSGASFYGDHLLLQRLYQENDINEAIDGLGERIVAYFGPEAVNPAMIGAMAQKILMGASESTDVMKVALKMEMGLQEAIRRAWQANQAHDMSLGLDDFLMALANERDTAIYLLRQRTA